ncbi:MAG: ribosome silencing factor, partial [Polyangiaceae bacterium]
RGKQDALRPRRPSASAERVEAAAPRVKSSHAVDGAKKKITKAAMPRLSGESTSVASDDARELAIMVAAAALEKKASGLEILDVAGKVDYADFLVLMTGTSDRQVAALAQGIEDSLRLKNRRALSIEGLPHAHWVLMDYGDVVVHVFQDETRGLYDLEGLWMDARRLPVPVPDDLR